MSRATAEAPANIAFIKYWGAREGSRALPLNRSISMTLESCRSTTTVEVLGDGRRHEILYADGDGPFGAAAGRFAERIRGHLAELLGWTGEAGLGLRVATRNSFPAGAGLASSASGFAALTVATLAALGHRPLERISPGELSSLARRSGSGSAARSVIGGFVEWPAEGDESKGEGNGGGDGGDGNDGGGTDDPRAAQVAPAGHWELADVIAVVEEGPKRVSSLEGHRRATTSPHYARRLELLPERLAAVRRAIRERDLARLGPVLEAEAIELHLIAMSSRPPIFYWQPATLAVLAAVRELRAPGLGLDAWATMDAGANVHVICPFGQASEVAARLLRTAGVRRVLRDRVGTGPRMHGDPEGGGADA